MVFDKSKYDLVQQENIEDIKTQAYMFRHKKSGARIAILANDDENKVFTVGFRTPPADSTGVMHILEHSVLCGSEKYPIKDPFIELAKGSLNTFLNAMTYSDKTIYPVASCNDVDFNNLIDVYMDAVLHPDIYNHKEIFMQEGWHYEMEDVNSPLIYNGVVYNEMKGAFSAPDDVLSRYCLNSLYPDTSYATESGGDPEVIPELTYEHFIGTHKMLYHPSNSYIVIYGNCDMSEKLEYLDREYLSKYEAIEVDSQILIQKPFESMRKVTAEYSVTEDEGTENNGYLAYNVSVGESSDMELSLAMTIIDYALFSAPGAPVRQALIDAGLGEDIICLYEPDIRQPMYTIASKNCDETREKEFLDIIQSTLSEIVEKGIEKDALLAAISSSEFRYRESDSGNFPKGLIYTTMIYDTWLHDDDKPFINLPKNDLYKLMRGRVDSGYFEEVIRKYFLQNNHCSLVVLKPVVNLTQKKDEALAEKLAEYKASLSEDEIRQIVADTKHLKEYQMQPDTEEALSTIPHLSRKDIRREIIPFSNIEKDVNGVKLLRHNIFTNGIGYVRFCFDIAGVATEDLNYVGLLVDTFAYIDTENYKYDRLTNVIDIHTGDISAGLNTYRNRNTGNVLAAIDVKCKAISEEYATAMDLVSEIILRTKFDEFKRLKEIIAELKASLHDKFVSAGHNFALGECKKQFNEASKYIALTAGYDYYRFLVDIYDNFDNCKEKLASTLKKVSGQVFNRNNLVISFTGEEVLYNEVEKAIAGFIDTLPDEKLEAAERNFEYKKTKLAYKTASMVNYVARCGRFDDEYDASIRVLRTMLAYDYLWTNVRVKGGAYGCVNGYTETGFGFYCSYRDPNIAKTIETFEQIPQYIDELELDENDMTKYIIGTFSSLDMPQNPQLKGYRSFDMYMCGFDEKTIQGFRDKTLNTSVSDIKKLKPVIQKILDDGYCCVLGNSAKIDENAELFDEMINL